MTVPRTDADVAVVEIENVPVPTAVIVFEPPLIEPPEVVNPANDTVLPTW